ncbi:MAG: hypothetical protein GY940_15895, partial [bacterium]|nr:hypothetical protein [bacterium]
KDQEYIEIGQKIVFTPGETEATVIDARGKTKTFTHQNDHPYQVTSGGFTTTFEQNDDGLVTKITYPRGNYTQFTYYENPENSKRLSQGNLVSVLNEANDGLTGTIETKYEYGTYFNQVNKITDPKQNETTITHDEKGNAHLVTPPNSPAYQYEYNKYGQLEKITDPMGTETKITYYPEKVPSGDGQESTGGRLLDGVTGGYRESITLDPGNDNISQAFYYNKFGDLTGRIDGEGVTTIYGIANPFGEVKQVIQGATGSANGEPAINLVSQLEYDENGNVTASTSRGIRTEFEYDRLNRLEVKRHKGSSAEGGEIVQEYRYEYNNNSGLTKITYPKGNYDTFDYTDRDLLD